MDGDTQISLKSIEAELNEIQVHLHLKSSAKGINDVSNSAQGDQRPLEAVLDMPLSSSAVFTEVSHSPKFSSKKLSALSAMSVPNISQLDLIETASATVDQTYWKKSQSFWSLSQIKGSVALPSTGRLTRSVPNVRNCSGNGALGPKTFRSSSDSNLLDSFQQCVPRWLLEAHNKSNFKYSPDTVPDDDTFLSLHLKNFQSMSLPTEGPYRPPIFQGIAVKDEDDSDAELPQMSTILEQLPWNPEKAKEYLQRYLHLAQQRGDEYKVQKLKQQLKYLTIRNKKRSYRNIASHEEIGRWVQDDKKKTSQTTNPNAKSNESTTNTRNDQKNNSPDFSWRSGMRHTNNCAPPPPAPAPPPPPPPPSWEASAPLIVPPPPLVLPPWNNNVARPLVRVPFNPFLGNGPFPERRMPMSALGFRPMPEWPPLYSPLRWPIRPPAPWNAYNNDNFGNGMWDCNRGGPPLAYAGGDMYNVRQERRWNPQHKRVGSSDAQALEELCKKQKEAFSKMGPIYSTVSLRRGKTARLPCVKSCDQAESGHSWFRRNLRKEESKVDLDLHTDEQNNHISEDKQHRLIIKDLDDPDIGTYFCRPQNDTGNDQEPPVYYYLDIDDDVKGLTPVEGDPAKYDEFADKLNEINDEKLSKLPDKEALEWRAFTSWGPWGPCSECEKPGTRRRVGSCRVRKMQDPKYRRKKSNVTTLPPSEEDLEAKEYEKELNIGLSCYSRRLTELPKLQTVVRTIQPFVLIEECIENCTELQEELAAWEQSFMPVIVEPPEEIKNPVAAEEVPIVTDTKTVPEGRNIFLPCHGAQLNFNIMWINGTHQLDPEVDKRIRIDAYGILHIQNAGMDDNAVFTCWVNGVARASISLLVLQKPGVKEAGSYALQLTLGLFMCFLIFVALLFVRHKQRPEHKRKKVAKGPGIYRNFLIPKFLQKPGKPGFLSKPKQLLNKILAKPKIAKLRAIFQAKKTPKAKPADQQPLLPPT